MLAQNFGQIASDAGVPSQIFGNPGTIITKILPYIFGAAGIILLLNIIVSGYQLMTSAGEPKTMQAAKAKITTSVIGIIIIFVSFWLVNLIMKFFGVTQMQIIN